MGKVHSSRARAKWGHGFGGCQAMVVAAATKKGKRMRAFGSETAVTRQESDIIGDKKAQQSILETQNPRARPVGGMGPQRGLLYFLPLLWWWENCPRPGGALIVLFSSPPNSSDILVTRHAQYSRVSFNEMWPEIYHPGGKKSLSPAGPGWWVENGVISLREK